MDLVIKNMNIIDEGIRLSMACICSIQHYTLTELQGKHI